MRDFLHFKQKLGQSIFKNKIITVLWITFFWFILAMYLYSHSFLDLVAAKCINDDYKHWPVIKITLISISLGGVLLGSGLVFLWENWLRKVSYLRAISYIVIFYTICYISIHLISGSIYFKNNPNASIDNNLYSSIIKPLFGIRHLLKYLFWLFTMLLTMSFFLIRYKFGPKTFTNFLSGKYFRPKREERIFMFMDLKSSTSIAEKLGEEQYFNFLNDTFRIATPAILETNGEIYQYVGDEIVISWPIKKGLYQANCIACHYKITKLLKDEFEYFDKKYATQANFKSGLHSGTVIAGEMGVVKREIVYTGDVLSTAARIQSLCNEIHAEILISKELIMQIELTLLQKKIKALGKIDLRGKEEKVELVTLIDNRLSSLKNNKNHTH